MMVELDLDRMVSGRKRNRKQAGRLKVLDVLVNADNYLLIWELKNLAGYSEAYCKFALDQLWRSGHVEKVTRGNRGNLWRITKSGRQDYDKLTEMFGFAPVARDTPIAITESRRQYLLQQEQKAAKKAEKAAEEAKLIESFKNEKALLANESRLRRYFLYDLDNPVDAEIVKRISARGHEEYYCKKILCKRLSLGYSSSYQNVDQAIENKLLHRCKKKGKTRNEMVRELFCVHFNIKMVEVG